MFPSLPKSSKISPELEARITLDFQSSVPRCSRFQHTSSAGGNTTTTTTTVGDTFANHVRPTRAQRSSVSSAAETTTTFSSTASRFQRRPTISSAAGTITSTTSTVAQRARASRFQRPSFSSANGATAFTNTMSSDVRYPDPVCYPCSSCLVSAGVTNLSSQIPSSTLAPLRAQQPAKATTKPARVIQCDLLPGGKFPTTYSGLDYDTSKETMARTADEDYVIWKWITKLGKDWGEQGVSSCFHVAAKRLLLTPV